MMDIGAHRLHSHQLSRQVFKTPADVVAWLGAVQAQEYAHAKWGLGLRLNGATDAGVEEAFTRGDILRTHVMRPTWHFVTPADIRWLLALTAPRVNAVNLYMYRSLELDAALFRRSNAAIAGALQGGRQLTRTEIAGVLKLVGIDAQGMRLGYIMHRAELDAVICSGARRGKQFTYALLDERVPHAKPLPRDQALAELTGRYFKSHGPATIQDFVWWSGLTMADAKAGIQMAGSDLAQGVIARRTYWISASMPVSEDIARTAYLLPPYDEYTIAYKDHTLLLDPQHAQQVRDALFGGTIVVGGQVIGYWRRTFDKQSVTVKLEPFRALSTGERAAIATAAHGYGAFLQLGVSVLYHGDTRGG